VSESKLERIPSGRCEESSISYRASGTSFSCHLPGYISGLLSILIKAATSNILSFLVRVIGIEKN
jgi:hypothetical protein